MKNIFFLLFILAGFTGIAQAQEQTVKHRVVMQMSSADTLVHKGLFNQLNALKEYWGDEVSIEVLLHGPGVDLVIRDKATQLNAIASSRQKGVHFIVCENTLKQRKIEKEKLIEDMDYGAFGQVHLVTRQEEGWSYIKVGF
jgi:intracellular sulfur oxidation DsrE/DsrF family protein